MAKEISAGISISGNRAQLAVFRMKDTEHELVLLDEYLRPDESDLWYLKPLLEPHKRILKKVTRVSIALDNGSVFLHMFPIDTSLTQSEQNEHRNWELSKFIPEFHPKNFICDTHVLRTRSREQVAEVLVVAVQRLEIFQIQETLAQRDLNLHLIDTAFFGAHHTLLHGYPEIKVKTVALVMMNEGRVDIGLEFNGRLIEYRYSDGTSLEHVAESLRGVMEGSECAEIFSCGSNATQSFSTSLGETLALPSTLLQPFRRMIRTSSFGDYGEFAGTEHHFAASSGIAMRRQ